MMGTSKPRALTTRAYNASTRLLGERGGARSARLDRGLVARH
jgi:hypothetical protein